MTSQLIKFEILLRAQSDEHIPSVSTIDEFKPKPDDINRAERWFSAQGVIAHTTDFGLVCSAPKEVFESLFGVSLTPVERGSSHPDYRIQGNIIFPDELRDIIEQVTLAVQPELF